jgi:hypothetical protein
VSGPIASIAGRDREPDRQARPRAAPAGPRGAEDHEDEHEGGDELERERLHERDVERDLLAAAAHRGEDVRRHEPAERVAGDDRPNTWAST